MTQTITQTQISTFERCKRCFYLRYLQKFAWPGKRRKTRDARRGEDFHLIIRQLILGIPEDQLIIPEEDEKLKQWTAAWCREKPLQGFQTVYAEKEVTALFADILWLGKFDALAINDDRITIFDWKTTPSMKGASFYINTPQTRLYRFLAKTCGSRLLGGGMHGIPAENIEMIYWFPEHPKSPIRLRYTEEAWQDDLSRLRLSAREMSFPDEAHYPKTDKERECQYCDYRKLCFPGQSFPEPDETEEDPFGEAFQAGFLFPDLFEDEETGAPGIF